MAKSEKKNGVEPPGEQQDQRPSRDGTFTVELPYCGKSWTLRERPSYGAFNVFMTSPIEDGMASYALAMSVSWTVTEDGKPTLDEILKLDAEDWIPVDIELQERLTPLLQTAGRQVRERGWLPHLAAMVRSQSLESTNPS